jgi:hypothetical protein
MSNKYIEIPGSFRAAPPELTPIAAVHQIKPSEPIEVSVYLKDRGADPLLNQGPISATDAAARNRGISQRRETADH